MYVKEFTIFFVFLQYFGLWFTCLICRSDVVLNFRSKLDELLKKQRRGCKKSGNHGNGIVENVVGPFFT